MSTFPALRPTERSWADGQLPMQSFVAMAGTETRIVTGNTLVGQRLTLGFANILESNGHAITQHYQDRRGSLLTFELPAEAFAGWYYGADSKQAGMKWRYAGPPSVAFVGPGVMTVSVELVAVVN